MRPIYLSLFLLSSVSCADTGKLQVEKVAKSTQGREVTIYTIETDDCKLAFEAIVNASFNESIKYVKKKKENCRSGVGSAQRVIIYREVISEIVNSGFLAGDEVVAVSWGGLYEMQPLRCKIIQYAETSEEWLKIVKKDGDKPVEFHEETPMEYADFIRKSSALKEVEQIFNSHGYYLDILRIRSFRSIPVNEFKADDKKCLTTYGDVKIFPYDAQIYLSFIKEK